MAAIYLFVICIVRYGSGANFAQYSETKIVENNCGDRPVLSATTSSKIGCAKACGEDRECRRYLYCSSDSSCKLYQDGTDCVMSADPTPCTCFRKDISCHGPNCTCPLGYYGDVCQYVVQGCKDAFSKGMGDNLKHRKALTYIQPSPTSEPFEMLCFLGYGGAWYFLSRKVECDHDTFNRSLVEYEEGFGKTRNNFWLGFNKIQDIMGSGSSQIQVHLKTDAKQCFVNYNQFQLGSKSSGYSFFSTGTVHRGGLQFCGDSMLSGMNLTGNPFSTYDVDHTGTYHCASRLGGGWWFANSSDCSRSFLTGSMSYSQNDVFWLDNATSEVIQAVTIALWI